MQQEFDIQKIISLITKSNANFAKRLRDVNRKHITDWEDPSKIATHKLGVGTDDNGNHFIYPEVQEIDGELVDFTRPPYAWFSGQNSAIERKDTVRVKTIQDGVNFTKNYKKYYKGF